MNHQQTIDRYGGKAASLLAQYNTGNVDFLFPFSIVEASEFERGNIPVFQFRNPQIVRGSARGDERGLVDVIRTYRHVPAANLNGQVDLREADRWTREYINSNRVAGESDEDVVERLLRKNFVHPIDKIIFNSRSDEVLAYAKWDGLENFSGASSVIIQPENNNRGSGSVVEHPNIRDHYLISYESHEHGWSGFSQYLADADGNVVVWPTITDHSERYIKSIVQMKKRSRQAGFVPQSHSSQVEFGFLSRSQDLESQLYDFKASPSNDAIFYQERAFLPFDFSLGLRPDSYRFNRFGRLPEQPLRVVKMDEVKDSGIFSDGIPSVYVAGDRFIHALYGFPLWFRPENMVGYIIPFDIFTKGGNTLQHNNFRFVQKAQFSLLKRPILDLMKEESFKHGDLVQLTESMLR